MKARTFTVPFATVVGEEATELEFGPDDYMVVRPIFTMSAERVRERMDQLDAIDDEEKEALKLDDRAERKRTLRALNVKAAELTLALLADACVEWSLKDDSGEAIAQPRTVAAFEALPSVLRGALFPFLTSYRGDAAHPTPLN